MKKRVMLIIGSLAAVVIAGVVLVNTSMWKSEDFRAKMGWQSYGREDHGTYHDCQWNRDVIIDEAKQELAKAKGWTNGQPITWQDLAPIITTVQSYASTRIPGTPPDYLPKCPCGGTYTLNPIGADATCSHPYHQWYNCMWKTDRSR